MLIGIKKQHCAKTPAVLRESQIKDKIIYVII